MSSIELSKILKDTHNSCICSHSMQFFSFYDMRVRFCYHVSFIEIALFLGKYGIHSRSLPKYVPGPLDPVYHSANTILLLLLPLVV